MKTEQVIALIPDYLEGNLPKEEHAKVKQFIAESEACQKELKAYEALFSAFKKEPLTQPSKALKENFFKVLEEEKQQTVKVVSLAKDTKGATSWFNGFFKLAASVALLVTAFYSGRYFSSQEAEAQIAQIEEEQLQLKQTTMMSLLENQSASKRIQAVSFIDDFDAPNDAVVRAIAERMLHDENTNVRLAAVEALTRFSASKLVKMAFVEALGTEKDPSVQIAIIQNLVKLQEKNAVEPMKKLLEQEDTQPFVKDEINQVLSEII